MKANQSIEDFGKIRIPVMQMKWLFMAVSIIAVALSFYFIFTKGFNFGVDFSGGVKLVYQFEDKTVDEAQVREILVAKNLGDQVVRYGKQDSGMILVKLKSDDAALGIKALEEELTTRGKKFTKMSEENIGPKAGSELRRKGLFSIILTCILILIYIGWRFDFLFAPGAIIALMHDVVIAMGAFALLGKEVNLPILAAVLTIIGYSINDTIIIYDRIRENLKKLPPSLNLSDVISLSVNETLSRTIVTSLTVLFAVLVLFYFGGGVIHDFAFCMIVGVIAGSYSTIFVASPIYLGLSKLFPGKGILRGKK